MLGESRPVLQAGPPWSGTRGRCKQHRQTRCALYQHTDRRTGQTQNEIALPVTRHRPVVRGTHSTWPVRRQAVRFRHSGPRPCTYRARSMALWLIHVADPHCSIIRDVQPQAADNLLRAPQRRPPSWSPRFMPADLPGCYRPGAYRPARTRDHPGQSLPDAGLQYRVDGSFRRLSPA